MTIQRVAGAAGVALVAAVSLFLLPGGTPAAARAAAAASARPAGVEPVGLDGKPLNLGFETGDLTGWAAAGNAFKGQPVKGDTVSPRRADQKSGHRGEFWVGGFEIVGDDGLGTLTSKPFRVDQRWGALWVAGGPWAETRVELVRADNNRTYFQFSGYENETLRPVVVDFGKQVGQNFYIRIVDERQGHWGHVNFDGLLLFDERPKFADELDPKTVVTPPQADVVQFAGLTAEQAVKEMTLPEGFTATVFAAEPDVVQPIAFTIDHRGRLWVAEGMTYPQRQPEGKGKDRIVIFEDTDADGKHDKRTVFAEKLNLVSGIEVGFGGVWVGAAPYLLFIPDQNGDDKPDAEPQVLLDGWGWQDTHETLNTFAWGPDGWLYGCHGVFTHSNVGKPGASDQERTKINAGIWRYHPTRHAFEVFAEGTSNPWGLDFDERGQCFVEACVIPHLWHVIHGARYQRQAGNHFNPFIFDDIKQVADHVHYAGNQGPHAANGRSDAAGGGHAHAGLMIYLGGAWPDEYRGQIFIGNIHGQRINVDIPERKGSGFVGRHGKDFLNFNDRWSQVINFRYGPDGNAYFIDWYDANQCHRGEIEAHDRKNGRIYKVSHRITTTHPDLGKMDDAALVQLLEHRNEWYARTARRLLQERAAGGKINDNARASLSGMLAKGRDETLRLRALWTLHAIGAPPEAYATALASRRPHLAAWAVQLLCEDGKVPERQFAEFVRLAGNGGSPVVRLYLASALQRVAPEHRWDVLAGLLSHSEDAADHNLPLMYWYALEPTADIDPERMLAMALETKIPNILSFTVRRLAATEGDAAIAALATGLGKVEDEGKQLDVLKGINEALKGRPKVPMPKGWQAVEVKLSGSKNEQVRSQVQALAVTFGSSGALDTMRKVLADAAASADERRVALEALLGARDESIVPTLQRMLADDKMCGPALRGLAAFDDPHTAALILKGYASYPAGEKRDALNTLASRESSAEALLGAVDAGKVPASDITADIIRQLRNLANPRIEERIAKSWQVQRPSPEEKLAQIAAMKHMLTASAAPAADPVRGRVLFVKTCQQCHTLFDVGSKVGPDITGSNRADLDYLLLHVLDPNAVIPQEYRSSILKLKDGRVVTGIVSKQDGNAVTVLTNTETLVIPRPQVTLMKEQDISMMPEGLLDVLQEQEKRDLVAYLRSPAQVPLPEGFDPGELLNDDAKDAKEEPAAEPKDVSRDFFNGKDLTGFTGREDVWSVQDGELVGKSEKGLPNNEFLKSKMRVRDFRLVFKVKLVPNNANSGVQFRSEPVENSPEMKGYQADIGEGWWGKLYHESGRGLLWDKGAPDDAINKEGWNTYEVLAVGHKIRTAVNGVLCVDLDDPQGELEGVIAPQVHSGGPTEVRFKDFELELNPKWEMKTVKGGAKK